MSDHVSRRGFIGSAAAAAGGLVMAGAEAAQGVEPAGRAKIIGVNCSRRAGENTARALAISLDAPRRRPDTIEVELMNWQGRISTPNGGGIELAEGRPTTFCRLRKIGDPSVAGIIIGSPVFSRVCRRPASLLERFMVFKSGSRPPQHRRRRAGGEAAAARAGSDDHVDSSPLFGQHISCGRRGTATASGLLWGDGGRGRRSHESAAAEALGQRVARLPCDALSCLRLSFLPARDDEWEGGNDRDVIALRVVRGSRA